MSKTVISKTFLVGVSLILSFHVFSQEQLGIRLENYAGANGTTLNPTHSLDYPLRWNLNLVGLGFFIDNTYGYITNSKVGSLVRNEIPVEFGPSIIGNRPSKVPIADFYDKKRTTYLIMNTVVNGPALSMKIGENHAAGLFINTRFAGSVTRVPAALRFYEVDKKKFDEEFEIKKFGGALMNWDEIGANYAFRKETQNGFLQFGINVKYLKGYEATFAKVNENFIIARRLGDSIKINTPSVSYGFTNGNFSNVKNKTYERLQQGNGIGFDLGVTSIIENNDFDDYWMKFSASILDIGGVKFSQTAEEHIIQYNAKQILDTQQFQNVKSPDEAVKILSYQLKQDSSKTFVDNNFSIGLPTALCLQADYQVYPHVFANATLIQKLPYQSIGIRRGNLLAVSARYEHRWFSVLLPIQLYQYQKLRLGFAARLAFLTIGTDYLGSYLVKNNFTGTDFYMAIKVNPVNLGLGRITWFDGIGKKNKKVDCYKF